MKIQKFLWSQQSFLKAQFKETHLEDIMSAMHSNAHDSGAN